MDIINQCNNKTDQELVALTLENQDYFLCIIKRYKIKLFNYIRRITNIDEEEIEDLLQEVFLKAYQNLNDFDRDLKFSSWIYSIAHNQAISHYRKTKVRPQGNLITLEDEKVKNISADLNIEKEIDLEILNKNIFKILYNLDNKYREVLILKFFEEKSYQEISDIIKRPMGTVASLINRAKEEFRKELKRQNIKLGNI